MRGHLVPFLPKILSRPEEEGPDPQLYDCGLALCQGQAKWLSMTQEGGAVVSHCVHEESEAQRGWVTCPRLQSNRSKDGTQTQVSNLWNPSTNLPAFIGWQNP